MTDWGEVLRVVLGAAGLLVAAGVVVRSSHTKSSLSLIKDANAELRQDIADQEARWERKLTEAEARWEAKWTDERDRRLQVEGRLQAMTVEWASTVAQAVVEAVLRALKETALINPFVPPEAQDDHPTA